jgi:predicted RecB family nuclease
MAHRALELDEQGYRTIFDLTEDVLLGAAADRQRRAVQTGRVIVDAGLADALAPIAPPVAFLDFETVGLAIPVWNGCHPYDQVPVQFSCHVSDAAGHVTHHAWLAEGPADPRPALAERLVTACADTRTIVAYHAPFERQCIVQLAEAVPSLAAPLGSIAERLVDLLPIVRNHVYHPAFGGSFSLKRVLPALVPEARYDELVIAGGQAASLELARLLLRDDEIAPAEKEAVRRALLAYCHLDTRGLIELLARLRLLAG